MNIDWILLLFGCKLIGFELLDHGIIVEPYWICPNIYSRIDRSYGSYGINGY